MAYGTINADVIQSSVTGVSLGAGNATSFKNRIINGGMTIDQRNAGASTAVAPGYTYNLDRWVGVASQASKLTVQQNAGSVTPPAGFVNYLGFTSSSAYAVTSTDEFGFQQRIEGLNVADLAWGTANAKSITFSAWVYSSLTGTFGGSISNSASNRCYVFTYSIPVANTWTQISVTVAGDTTGTWLTTNGIGLRLNFGLGVGTTYSGTPGSWGSTYYDSATGATSVVGTSGATFYFTGVQLEVGSSATGFDFRDYGTELGLCYRYFRQYSSLGNTNSSVPMMGTGSAQTGGLAIYRMGWTMDIAMRSAPSIIFSGVYAWAGTNVVPIATSTNYSGSQYVDLDTTTSGLNINSSGCVAKLYFPNTAAYVQVSSEL